MTHSTASTKTPFSIRVDHVSKVYGDFVALHQVTFEVRPGTVVAFLGPNGAGKSTTMKILTGYLSPTSGTVEVGGFDPTRAESRVEMARLLGYLPENGPLYGEMTPQESLEFFAEVRKLENRESAIRQVVDRCSIASVLHKPINKLSKGFRQRVGMAQALLHDPDILILDEPTSGLDPLQIRDVRALIRELGRTKTVLMSTHILQEVDAVADEVVVVSEGRSVFSGTKDAIAAGGGLEKRFYELTSHSSQKEVA